MMFAARRAGVGRPGDILTAAGAWSRCRTPGLAAAFTDLAKQG